MLQASVVGRCSGNGMPTILWLCLLLCGAETWEFCPLVGLMMFPGGTFNREFPHLDVETGGR